ncbi:MAG: hypothetical protein IKC87_03850 [Clostridia bacterium]|nr:hypothetical protein [Clostridia bacterium]
MEDKNIQNTEEEKLLTEDTNPELAPEDVDAIFGECDEEDVKWNMTREELDAAASEILGVDTETLKGCSKEIAEDALLYYWNPKRGGLHMLIDETGEKLVAGSIISFEKLLEEFRGGRRN